MAIDVDYTASREVKNWTDNCINLAVLRSLAPSIIGAATREINALYLEQERLPLLEGDDRARAITTIRNLRGNGAEVLNAPV